MLDERRHIEETDLMIRSILDQGHEDVPAGIWEAVAEGLDRIEARRKAAMMWWRRAAIATAAAAAIAAGVFISTDNGADNISKPTVTLVAEGAPAEINVIPLDSPAPLMAYVPKQASKPADVSVASIITPTEENHNVPPQIIKENNSVPEEVVITKTEKTERKEPAVTFPEEWDEIAEIKADKTIRTSLVLSGVAGSNSSPHRTTKTQMRLPGTGNPLKKTTITDKDQSAYGIPVSLGLGVKIDFAKRWAVSAGVSYTMLFRQFNGGYTEVKDGLAVPTLYSEITNVQHYIGIPVNVFYDIIKKEHVNFYAYAGGAVEKCLADKYEVLSYSITHTENVEGLQWSAEAGIGVEFIPWKRLGIYIDPSIRYYFDCNQPRSIRTAQPFMFGLEIGFRFLL